MVAAAVAYYIPEVKRYSYVTVHLTLAEAAMRCHTGKKCKVAIRAAGTNCLLSGDLLV